MHVVPIGGGRLLQELPAAPHEEESWWIDVRDAFETATGAIEVLRPPTAKALCVGLHKPLTLVVEFAGKAHRLVDAYRAGASHDPHRIDLPPGNCGAGQVDRRLRRQDRRTVKFVGPCEARGEVRAIADDRIVELSRGADIADDAHAGVQADALIEDAPAQDR